VTIKRSSGGEIARLIAEATGEDHVSAEAAVARLAIAGQRAVERVSAALEGAGPRQQAMLLLALERIGDPRALPVAEARLPSTDERVAVAAVGALRPLLQHDRSDVAHRAIAAVTGVALDTNRPDAVRAAALDALHDLGTEPFQAVTHALEHDPSGVVRRLAGWTTDEPKAQAGNDAAAALQAWATGGVPDDPDLVRSAALEAGQAVPLTDLHRLVVVVRDREAATSDPLLRERWTAARGALHQVLAARGSRVALYDLRETVGRSGGHLPITMLSALSAIGDASCLEPLAAAIGAAREPWAREQLARAFGDIRRRERLTKRHAVMKRIASKFPGVPTE
jgi:hypothetical protein